jgi:hypothetical protein
MAALDFGTNRDFGTNSIESLLCCDAAVVWRYQSDPIMSDQKSNPAFEARRLLSAAGWYVRVAWPFGKLEHIPGFVSQREAVRWIEERAGAWLSERNAFPMIRRYPPKNNRRDGRL